jgi:hypothetical protein
MAVDIEIRQMYHSVDSQGDPVRVTRIDYVASKTQDAITVSLSTSYLKITDYYPPANVAYETVSEADAIAWVNDLEDMVEIEAQLDALLGQVTAPALYSGLPWVPQSPVWVVGVEYFAKDSTVQYLGIEYECVQSHTAQTTWPPDITPALWMRWDDPALGPQPWVQPTGAQDAYAIGDQVTHEGHLWESNTAANVWEPGVFGWDDLGFYP